MIRKEQWDEFLKGLRCGLSLTDSCAHTSIDRGTVYNRKKRDAKFSAEFEKALIAPKVRAIQVVQRAFGASWQSAAWWLERKHKDEFALRSEHVGANGQPLEINIVNYASPNGHTAKGELNGHAANGSR